LEKTDVDVREWEKKTAKVAGAQLQSRAAQIANDLATSHRDVCVTQIPDADAKLLQAVVDGLKQKVKGPIFLAGRRGESVALVAYVPAALTSKFQANKIMQQIAPMVAGKGGGRPELAQGSGKDASKIELALTEARKLLG
jgi:alanyl-tRNA synthetase